MNLAEKVEAFTLGTQALEAAQVGNQRSRDSRRATKRLRQTAVRLASLGQSALAEAMDRYALALDKGMADAYGVKQLRYDTRCLAQRLSQSWESVERL
jgi:hypothetical protein